MSRVGWILGVLTFSVMALAFAQDEVTLTTYYPSPRGVYKELRVGSSSYPTPTGMLHVVHAEDDGNFSFRVDDELDFEGTDPTPFVIDQEGNVGIGTTAPAASLDIRQGIFVEGGSGNVDGTGGININDLTAMIAALTTGVPPAMYARADIDGDGRVTIDDRGMQLLLLGRDPSDIDLHRSVERQIHNTYGAIQPNKFYVNGNVGVGLENPVRRIQVAEGAYCDGFVWQNASSRTYKQDIHHLSVVAAQQALAGLEPVRFRYRGFPEEQQVGFIAEDVPELVASADRKGLSALDIVAVLTKVVQEQQGQIEELRHGLAVLQGER